MTNEQTTSLAKEAWGQFRQGNKNTRAELEAMRQEIVEALPFLRHHPDAGAMMKVALMDLTNIDSYLAARKIERVGHTRC